MFKQEGFTLIELLTVIAVIAILIVVAIFSYRYFEKNTELDMTAQKIVVALRSAQTKTLSSEEASQYGVHFENSKYILFKGDAYQIGNADNIEYQLPSRLEINNINIGGGSDVVFQRINGRSNQSGSVDLINTAQLSDSKTINIQTSGQVEIASSLSACCETNRITDSRHIHFDLGWSIQTANTLTLYFTDLPELTTNIDMTGYFNVSLTEFDWSGVIDVNGQDQELRIHTHSLDATNTGLCIHRDRGENNKSLQISIDSKDIVSYTANGQEAVGFWGGTMETQ